MLRPSFVWLILGFTFLLPAGAANLTDGWRDPSPNFLQNAYIVELYTPDALQSIAGLGTRVLTSPHDVLYKRLEERGIEYSIRSVFDDAAFLGVSLQLTSSLYVQSLASIHDIKSLYPVQLWQRPSPQNVQVLAGTSGADCPPDGMSALQMIGVDKLHAQGYLGKGVTVCVIDTGVDYSHPYLGSGFGPGHKVAFGYDFVGDSFNGSNTPHPDPDPLDQCAGHGTHVAGIIGANPGNPYGFSGVAYESTLGAYRIFGCTGTTPDDIIIAALLRANKDKCNVLNLSLGSRSGWSSAPSAVVASRIADMGKIVSISAGNDGSYGPWDASNPATGLNVISVASVQNTRILVQNLTVVGAAHGPIFYWGLDPLNLPQPDYPYDTPLSIYALSTNTSVVGDGCSPLPDSTPNLNGKVVLVRRGQCLFTTKLANIAAKGGNVTLIYDNIVETLWSPPVAPYIATIISPSDGEFLVKQFAAGIDIKVVFHKGGISSTTPSLDGGLVSSFTSYGPTNDMFFKPAVAAPGGNIISTYPVALGSYAINSGTSMAAPMVSGASALLFEKLGTTRSVARRARKLFETTALAIPSDKTGSSPLQTLAQQGAGLINVYNALSYGTTLTPGELLLNDTAHFSGTKILNLRNEGKRRQSYTLSHVPAGTINTIRGDGFQPVLGPIPLTTDYANVTIIPSSISLSPGATAKILVIVDPPKTGVHTLFPVYSGFIQVRGSLGEDLHSSYLGLNANSFDLKVIDSTSYYFGYRLPALWDSKGKVQAPGQAYALQGNDAPTLVYRLAAGTAALYVDLVSANTTFAPSIMKRDGVFEREWWPPGNVLPAAGKVAIVGRLSAFYYRPRNVDASYQSGGYNLVPITSRFANSTQIPKGNYKVLVRALKITGNPKEESSYESWLSTPFAVV
ncbi:subtilisin-like protease [Cantharellus anzutake]|uniref:subtilisin-like protease n=1 Tax=Cantharellus anzutake TaxID=1750568 RepID=UPI001908D9DA|nr:subtilisin-like protease [Cantharellus anzutake]KAF8337455.1 subtilisin-like protease [Cantharellus anzutake]